MLKITCKKQTAPMPGWESYWYGLSFNGVNVVSGVDRFRVDEKPAAATTIPPNVMGMFRRLSLAQNPKYNEAQREYIQELWGVDWFACMSDDGQVARRGEAHESRVHEKGKSNPELAGMYEEYRSYVWERGDRPEPFIEVPEVIVAD